MRNCAGGSAGGEPTATARPLVVPALIGAWSAIYLIGMLRIAAALYGF